MKAVRTLVQLHWGYSVKHPVFSAGQPSLRYPPPSTLLGALSYPLALAKGLPEVIYEDGEAYSSAVSLLSRVLWVCYRFVGLDPELVPETRDLSRVLIAPYVRSDNVYPGSANIWGVQAHGKVYAPGTVLDVVYLVRDGAADEAAKAAWGLVRLGCREALVSTLKVEVRGAAAADSSQPAETEYSFPLELVERIVEGSYAVERLPVPSSAEELRTWYKLAVVKDVVGLFRDYVIPRGPVKVVPSPHGRLVLVEDLGYLVVPSTVFAG